MRHARSAWLVVASAALVVAAVACTPDLGLPLGLDNGPAAEPTPDPNAVVWAVEAAPTTLDPALMLVDPSGAQIAAQVYDRLMGYRPGTAELAPGVASDWDADADGRTYTFTLRDGLTFHDGTPLDAAAVVWNFERWMDVRHPSHQGDFRPWLSLFGGFTGQRDNQGRETNLVERVDALDPLTVRFVLREPFAPFLYHLAGLPFGLASPAAVRAAGEAYGSDGMNLPVGSGPFRAVSWTPDGSVRLVANQDYWAGPPLIPGIEFVTIPDDVMRAEAVASGAVHGAPLNSTTPLTDTLAGGHAYRILPRPARANAWLMLNQSRRPLEDLRVRQAIDMAIDRTRLAREQFGRESLPSGQLLPPVFSGFDPEITASPYDPERARELLQEADATEGFKLNIWVPNTPRGYLPDPVGTAEALVEMLSEIGIDAHVRSEGLRQFLTDRENGRFTAWIIGWEAQSVDPDNFWFFHFGAGRAPSEGHYTNPELAKSLLDAQRTLGADRASTYQAAAQTVENDVARIFLAYTRPLVIVSDRIASYVPGLMGYDDFSSITFAPPPSGATMVPVPTSVPAAAATQHAEETAAAASAADGESDEASEDDDGDAAADGDSTDAANEADDDASADETGPSPTDTPANTADAEAASGRVTAPVIVAGTGTATSPDSPSTPGETTSPTEGTPEPTATRAVGQP